MKLWKVLSEAAGGWMAPLRGEPHWRSHFTISAAGLATALCIFLFAAFLAVAFASTSYGMPNLPGLLAAMAVLALPIFAVLLSLLGTRQVLKSQVPLLDSLVPAVYAATAFLLLEGALALLSAPLAMLSWLALGYALYRLVRLAYGWDGGVSASFATLSVLLLVAMRMAPYMLSASAAPAI